MIPRPLRVSAGEPLPRVTLNREEAAAVIGVGVTTVDEWTRAGFLPSIKRGGVRLYSVRALERWADEASGYEEAGRGKAALGNGQHLPPEWGRSVGRRRQRTPTPLRRDRARGTADAG